MTKENEIRMKYAGAIGLLTECHLHLSNQIESAEIRVSIQDAISDWCEITGWQMKVILNRIELIPPRK
jgi:hypothetical protein